MLQSVGWAQSAQTANMQMVPWAQHGHANGAQTLHEAAGSSQALHVRPALSLCLSSCGIAVHDLK